MTVPFVDLAALHAPQREELTSAMTRVMDAAAFVLSDEVEMFEHEFASFCEVSHAIGCGNGTDAIELILEAAGIGPGDEVIAPSHTFAATVEAILRVGAEAVLVDVDPHSLLIDPEMVRAAVTERTVAIVAVHLYGACANMTQLQEIASRHSLLLLEDAAQAHGARHEGRSAGSLADAATFSFYPSKNLGAFGDGGAITTRRADFAERARCLRDHGKSGKFAHSIVGRNSRLDAIQAAVLRVKLGYLDRENAARRVAARRYRELFDGAGSELKVVGVPAECEPVHHLFVVKVPDRPRIERELARRDVRFGIHYPVPVHLQPAFIQNPQVRTSGTLRATEEACSQIISLPMFPTISSDQQEVVVSALLSA